MDKQAPSLTGYVLKVDGIKGLCPAGEAWANRQIKERATPVLSCEGACIRGEIARLAAGMVAEEAGYGRGCHAETFTVPYSSMFRWIKEAERVVMIDGCFLRCHGRILNNLVDEDKVVHIDALKIYKNYGDYFAIDDVPEEERKAVARQVADKVLAVMESTDAA